MPKGKSFELRLDRSIESRLSAAARVSETLLRRTLTEAGFTKMMDGEPAIVVVTGASPPDGGELSVSAESLLDDRGRGHPACNVLVRDWTEADRLKPEQIQRFLDEACRLKGTVLIVCRDPEELPPIIVAVCDGIVPLGPKDGAIADVVEDLVGFRPDGDLLADLASLPLPYLNFAVREGIARDRMSAVAARMLEHLRQEEADEASSRSDEAAVKPTPRGPERLEDLHGMGEARRWGLRLARDLSDYAAGTLPWGDVENGVLLFGSPGTGKTLFARALAGTCDVPLHAHSFAAWQARGHLGDLLKAMRKAFQEARDTAPSILFVDELDSIGRRDEPHGDNGSYQRQVINGFLECLDGEVDRGGVVVVGATNYPGAIDGAVLRPGRLGRHIEIPLPDLEGRVGILRHHLRGELSDTDVGGIAEEIGEVSGATLAQLVRGARATAREERRPLREGDLWDAVPKGTVLSEAAFRRMCIHEAGHVIVGLELAGRSELIPIGARVRRTVRTGREHRTDFRVVEGFDQTRESFEANVAVLLAGVAAEEVLLGSRGSAAGGADDADLVRATQLAANAEQCLGLGEGLFTVPLREIGGTNALPAIDPDLRSRVEEILARCLGEARGIVERRREDVEAMAQRLAERLTVSLS